MKSASEFVLELMKKRRFLLPKSEEGSLDVLDPEIFAEAILLDENVRNTYMKAKEAAEEVIKLGEARLGLEKFTLPQGKNLVECNRFTGGFDICQVIDLYDFSEFIPYDHTSHDIEGFYYQQCFRGRDVNGFSPIQTSEFSCQAEEFATKVQNDFERLKESGPLSDRFILLLKSRFAPAFSDSEGDMMGGRLSDLQEFPHLTAYLLTKMSQERDVVKRNNFIITSTSYKRTHVSMFYPLAGGLQLDAKKDAGYDCRVYFATIV